MSNWMEVYRHPHELSVTRRKKAKRLSFYRQEKSVAHRTVNGVGCVGRLRRGKK